MLHQIVMLLVVPRSGSTMTAGILENSGHFKAIFHEPNAAAYYRRKNPNLPGMHLTGSEFQNYAQFKAEVLRQAQEGRVLIKDMVHHFYEDLSQDEGFVNQLDIVFLIREPRETVLSHLTQNPDATSEEIGFNALARFALLLKTWNHEYSIFDYEFLVNKPEQGFASLFSVLNLRFESSMLNYQVSHSQRERTHIFEPWHRTFLTETTVRPQNSTYLVAPDKEKYVQDLIAEHQKAYQSLKEEAMTPEPQLLARPILRQWQDQAGPSQEGEGAESRTLRGNNLTF